jgi:hypothetical protein
MTRTIRPVLALVLAGVALAPSALEAQSRGGARTNVTRDHNVNRNQNVNVNRNVNVNQNVNRNVNVNVNRNVNVDVDRDVYVRGGYYSSGCCYHPVATAAAITATAIAIGSIVNTLPASCRTVMVGGLTYHQCGSTWYQPQFVGTTTSYVVVVAPT